MCITFTRTLKTIIRLLSGCLLLSFVGACSSNQPSGWQNFKEHLDFRTEKGRYSGVTSIYKGSTEVFGYTGGKANRSWQIPNQKNTRFDLASVTKLFTAVAVAQLYEKGQIEWDAPFGRYFPGFPQKEIADNTSIRQLLSHTSGLSDFFFEEAYLTTDKNRLRVLSDYDPFFELLTQAEEESPRQMQYSNANYVILGRIIEQISGQSYYDYLQENIFEPAGMKNTGFPEADRVVPNMAEGYTSDPQAAMEFGVPNDGQVRRNDFMRAVKGMPAGGAVSTTPDMYRFFSALHNETLIKSSTLQLMTREIQNGYGLGFQTYRQNDIQVYGHSGGFYGVSTMAFHLPEQGYTFICLTNTDFAAQPVFDRFMSNLAGLLSYSPINMSTDEIKPFEGYFEVTEGDMSGKQIFIEAKDDRLLFDGALAFFPIGENRFFDIDNDQFILEFEKDQSGRLTGFTRTDGNMYYQKAKKITPEQVEKLSPIQLPKEVMQEYLGEYQFGDQGMMPGHRPSLKIEGNALVIDNMMRFLPFEKDRFFLQDDTGMRLQFKRNPKGEITGMEVQRGKEIVGIVKKLN